MKFSVTSSQLATRFHPTAEAAWEAFCLACRRIGAPEPLHAPGTVAGDLHEPGRVQGVRDGHGVVYLESQP